MKIFRPLLILSFSVIAFSNSVYSQFAVTYPVAAEPLSICNGQGTLRIKVKITATTSNNTITLALPNGITTIGGSQTILAARGVTGINFVSGTAQNPTFSISPANLTAGDSVDFTILRNADCAARASALTGGTFKDAVSVNGSAGSFTENTPTVNAYNVIYPSISLIPPTPINNATPGTNYTQTITINNGGNGCVNTLYFYTVSPAGSVQQLSLTIGGVAVPLVSSVGDTNFYSISGTMLSADNLLCNGEQVIVLQQIKFLNCAANPKYGAGWGCFGGFNGSCQKSLATGVLNGAAGTPLFTVTSSTPIPANRTMCTGWRTVVGLGNTGVGGVGANMYNVQVIYGMDYYSNLTTYVQNDGYYYNLTNWQIASTPAIITFTGPLNSQTGNVNTSQFLSDPDGAGGLSDLDGDGQFDDLASGQSVLVSVFETPVCTATCGDVQWPSSGPVCNLSWTNVCGISEISLPKRNSSDYFYGTTPNTTITIPPNVFSGTPFNVQVCLGLSDFNWPTIGGFRFEYRFTLPPGVSVSGNATWNGVASAYTQVGNEVTIFGAIGGGATCVSIDLVVNCVGPSQALNIGLDIDYINDVASNCNCRKDFVCSSINTTAICISNCTTGPALSYVEAKRTAGSMGYTDHTRTTRRLQSAVSATQLRRAITGDTISFASKIIQKSNDNDLFFELTLDKGTGVDKLTSVNAKVKHYRAGVLLLSTPSVPISNATSTATVSNFIINATSGLSASSILAGDSVLVEALFYVGTNNLSSGQVLAPGIGFIAFNLDASSNRIICGGLTPELYLIRSYPYHANLSTYAIASGCASTTFDSWDGLFHDNNQFFFGNEFRPTFFTDSIIYRIPIGYEFVEFRWNYNSENMPYQSLTPTVNANGILKFVNDGTWYTQYYQRSYVYSPLRCLMYIRPTCSAPILGQTQYEVYGRDFVQNILPVLGVMPAPSVGVSSSKGISYGDITYSTGSRPNIALTNLSGTVVADALNEIVDFRISSIGTTTAPYVWFAIPNVTGSIVNQVTNLATATVMTAIPYPGGNWYQFSTAGLATGAFNDFRIRFTYNNCNKDSIKVIAGWNCALYPTSPSTYSCLKDSIYLKFESANAEVQVTPILTPIMPASACTPLNYEYNILSAGQGNITNVRFYLQVPTGLTISTPLQAEYPIGSGNWTTIAPIPAGSFRIYNLFTHPFYPSATGLPGTNNSVSTPPREFKVRFAFTTDCNFVSGSNFSIAGFGRKTCGALAAGSNSPFQSPPIVLIGANVNYVMSHTLSSAPMACGGTSTITATSTVVGSSSGVGSFLTYLVPIGLNYLNGTLSCSSGINCPTFVSKIFNADGTELITFNIPDNVPSGVTMNYTFNLQDSVAQNCTANPSVLKSFANAANVPCASVAGGFCASVAVQTGQTSHVPVVSAGNLSIVSSTFNNNPSNPDYYIVGTQLLNSGQGNYTSGGGVTLSYYCADLLGNATGSALFTYNVNQNIASGATSLSGSSFFAPACAVNQNFISIMESTGTCHCAVDTARNLPVVIGPLPIELTQFQAERVNRFDAQIDWVTASESNTSHYIVLRSEDGTTYKEVGQKQASGNSSSDISYAFLDKNVPQSKLYYKLRQYDLDGNSKDYGPALLKGFQEFEDLTIYPNPTAGEIYFSQFLKGETVKVFDITGRIIFNETVEGNFMKLSNFDPGTYQILIMDEYNKSKILPIVLMK